MLLYSACNTYRKQISFKFAFLLNFVHAKLDTIFLELLVKKKKKVLTILKNIVYNFVGPVEVQWKVLQSSSFILFLCM